MPEDDARHPRDRRARGVHLRRFDIDEVPDAGDRQDQVRVVCNQRMPVDASRRARGPSIATDRIAPRPHANFGCVAVARANASSLRVARTVDRDVIPGIRQREERIETARSALPPNGIAREDVVPRVGEFERDDDGDG